MGDAADEKYIQYVPGQPSVESDFPPSCGRVGFYPLPMEWCVYIRRSPFGTVIFAVHVDDTLSIAWPPEENTRFKNELKSKGENSDLGPAKFALGIAIERGAHSISLSQTAIIICTIDRF